jgi:Family of unknown function (DUF6364)
MATTKLTLTVEPAVVEMAKRYAREHNTSVSATFSRMIRSVADASRRGEVVIPPRSALAKVAGIIALPPDSTVDDVLRQALEEKHGGGPCPTTGT